MTSLETRNADLCELLHERDQEHKTALIKLQEMRMSVVTVNEASKHATADYEARYETLHAQLQDSNEQLRMFQERTVLSEAVQSSSQAMTNSFFAPVTVQHKLIEHDLSADEDMVSAHMIEKERHCSSASESFSKNIRTDGTAPSTLNVDVERGSYWLYEGQEESLQGGITGEQGSPLPFQSPTHATCSGFTTGPGSLGSTSDSEARARSKVNSNTKLLDISNEMDFDSVCLITPQRALVMTAAGTEDGVVGVGDGADRTPVWGRVTCLSLVGNSAQSNKSKHRYEDQYTYEEDFKLSGSGHFPSKDISARCDIIESECDSVNNRIMNKIGKDLRVSIDACREEKVTSYFVPPNPFKDDTDFNTPIITDARDVKIDELIKELKNAKKVLESEKSAHLDTEHDFEMRLEVLLEQLHDSRRELEAVRSNTSNGTSSGSSGCGSGVVTSVEAEAERINESIKRRGSDLDFLNNNNTTTTTTNNNSTSMKSLQSDVRTSLQTPLCPQNDSVNPFDNAPNFILARPRIPSLKGVERDRDREVLYETISTLQNTQAKAIKENEIMDKKLKEVNELNSTLISSNAELERINNLIEIEKNKLKAEVESVRNQKIQGPSCALSSSSIQNLKMNDVQNTRDTMMRDTVNTVEFPHRVSGMQPDGTQISIRSSESNLPVPLGDEFFVVNKRDTEFLSIPFDSLNDLLPTQVLQLLISYKLELAIVSTDLENSKNELNRLKRMNIMTALPVPCLRQSASPMMKTRPRSAMSIYAEKESISDRSDNSVRLSSSSISANATRFSSDMLKSTASLMRFKTSTGAGGKRVGGGSVVGSVAGSISSFLGGGGSVMDDGDHDDDGVGSENGSLEGSVYSHAEYRRTRR